MMTNKEEVIDSQNVEKDAEVKAEIEEPPRKKRKSSDYQPCGKGCIVYRGLGIPPIACAVCVDKFGLTDEILKEMYKFP